VDLSRREFLVGGVGTLGAACVGKAAGADTPRERCGLGIVEHSYAVRAAADRARGGGGGIKDPLVFLDHARALGAGGIQMALGARDAAYVAKLREAAEAGGLYIEGSSALPRDRGDVDRFDAEARTAKEAGATVLRTAMLSGRRYETFRAADAFRRFAERSWQSLTLAEPVVARHGLRLAVENHKDWRTGELVDLLRRIGSAHVGACVDTGNSLALLEDPMSVVEALAPWAFATHLKDMGVEESDRGFMLSEVPLGDGFLDLARMVRILRAAHPEVRFSLEMITRDPLSIPCLTDDYWATFADVPGRDLARTLTLVRDHKPRKPLPRIKGLAPDEALRVEEDNVRRSLAYAKEHLGL
jgi:sugar phosphate isomerase/epimerase